MKRGLFILCALAIVMLPSPAFAWGWAAHRMITERAIEMLPPELKPLFERYKDEIVIRSVDPDQWRLVGFDESPNHFLDLGVPPYGNDPFDALPRDFSAAVEKFGDVTVRRYGLLPWRTAEIFGNLRRTFDEFPRNAPYTVNNLVLYAAATSHYVQDTYQPFHATGNFDGQLTGNTGIHDRFERDVFERFQSRLNLTPAPPTITPSIRDAAFDTLISSYRLVDPILKADREAIGTKDTYDDEYFNAFFAKIQPILERQLSGAITATASVIVSAWEQAGRPAVRLRDVRPVMKRAPR